MGVMKRKRPTRLRVACLGAMGVLVFAPTTLGSRAKSSASSPRSYLTVVFGSAKAGAQPLLDLGGSERAGRRNLFDVRGTFRSLPCPGTYQFLAGSTIPQRKGPPVSARYEADLTVQSVSPKKA